MQYEGEVDQHGKICGKGISIYEIDGKYVVEEGIKVGGIGLIRNFIFEKEDQRVFLTFGKYASGKLEGIVCVHNNF